MVNLIECLTMAAGAAAAATGDDTNDVHETSGVADALDGDSSVALGDDSLAFAAAADAINYSSNSSSPDTVSQCLSTWLIKTHTHFHGSEDLNLPWYFGALCWSYALGGMMMFVVQPTWTRTSKFPYRLMAWSLILLQSPLSYAADYLSMTDDSYIHTADRLLACPMMLFEMCKALTMFPHVRLGTFGLYIASVAFAIFSFIQSSHAQELVDADAFVFWHNCWHVYPLLVSVIMGFDYFVLGEYDREAAAKGVVGGEQVVDVTKTRRPLSSVVMEQADAVANSNTGRTTPLRRPRTATTSSSNTPLRRSARLRLRTNAHAVTAAS